ncbi:hypothetical protein BV25DRAFT_1824558 [Artomyces pyxidatus]|uniref:Uncharacterized protein n=1 Tax=Artomyces pyxidatus TaxID=48021 RepID=A0ACB8T438_9AGAM|nr:hypothetical protein BV25DRAFT_1824558 [Artomyces pyxidatus]
MSRQAITLYDIPSSVLEDKCWSPNVWKIRFALNFKGLPYKTEWVEFPDIEALAKRLGAPHTAVRRDGSPFYSVPIIYDPEAQKYVANALDIALYLDRAYPDTPPLFPRGAEAFIAVFEDAFMEKVVPHMIPLMMTRVINQLNDASKGFFRETREARLKAKLEDLAPPEKQEALWGKLRGALGKFDAYAKFGGTEMPYFAGARMTYADMLAAGWLVWMKRLWGPQSKEWKALEGWHDGRWGALMREISKLEYVEFATVKASL